jgi:hypothetical protein
MALTSLIIPKKEGNKQYLQVETIQGEKGIVIHWFGCDDKFEHTGKADASADRRSEEEFHKGLRASAAEKEQLITSHSTHPEWNPEGYVKNLKEYGSN